MKRAGPKDRRPLTLLDAMILVAATAIGLSAARAGVEFWDWDAWSPPNLLSRLKDGFRLTSCFVASWSVAIVVVGLRPPRPPLTRLTRQPGWVACMVVALTLSMTLLPIGFELFDPRWWATDSPSIRLPFRIGRAQFAPPIAATWLTLALLGAWRPKRDWIDRAGFAVGLYWLASWVVIQTL